MTFTLGKQYQKKIPSKHKFILFKGKLPSNSPRPKVKFSLPTQRLAPKQQQAQQHQPKQWYPTDVKTPQEKHFYDLVKLRPAGGWTESTVNESGHGLALKHWERVKAFAKKNPPKTTSKSGLQAWLKKAIMTPEQEVVMWSEASLRAPLSHEGYERYMLAFEKVVGKEQFKRLLGSDASDAIKLAKKQEKQLKRMYGDAV